MARTTLHCVHSPTGSEAGTTGTRPQPKDPLVLLATVAILVGVALFACWLPARRASNVDAMLALRAE